MSIDSSSFSMYQLFVGHIKAHIFCDVLYSVFLESLFLLETPKLFIYITSGLGGGRWNLWAQGGLGGVYQLPKQCMLVADLFVFVAQHVFGQGVYSSCPRSVCQLLTFLFYRSSCFFRVFQNGTQKQKGSMMPTMREVKRRSNRGYMHVGFEIFFSFLDTFFQFFT